MKQDGIVGRKLSNLRELLGEKAIFIPTPPREKGPRIKDWPQFTREDEKLYARKGGFREGEMALLLGKKTGLYALDFDAKDDYTAFMELNPQLKESFRVSSPRGRKIIVKAERPPPWQQHIFTGDIPPHRAAEVLSKIAKISGTHPDGEYGDNNLPARMVKWQSINWPETWRPVRKIIARLEARFGSRYILSEKTGRPVRLHERFWAALFGHETGVIYDRAFFWLYSPDSGLWRTISSARLRELIGRRLVKASTEENLPGLTSLATVAALDLITKALTGIVETTDFFLDRPLALHVKNGVLPIDGDKPFELAPFDPRWKSRNCASFDYNEGARCPRFVKELLKPMFPDREDRRLLQKWVGLCLLGINKPQCILILDGTAGRGKSCLARIIQQLVGDENCTQLRTHCLGGRFEAARFVGKTLLVGADVPGDFLMTKSAPHIKALVGGDRLHAEIKGSNAAPPILGNFNVLIVSNSRLSCRLDEDVEAWRRRLLILRTNALPVQRKIADFDKLLLSEEGPGILRWAVVGLKMAFDDMKEHRDKLDVPAIVSERVDALLAESAALPEFIKTQIEQCRGSHLTSEQIVKAFVTFCKKHDWHTPPVTVINRWLPDLMMRYHQVTKSNDLKADGKKAARGYRHVRLKEF